MENENTGYTFTANAEDSLLHAIMPTLRYNPPTRDAKIVIVCTSTKIVSCNELCPRFILWRLSEIAHSGHSDYLGQINQWCSLLSWAKYRSVVEEDGIMASPIKEWGSFSNILVYFSLTCLWFRLCNCWYWTEWTSCGSLLLNLYLLKGWWVGFMRLVIIHGTIIHIYIYIYENKTHARHKLWVQNRKEPNLTH